MPRVKIDFVASFSSEEPEHPANNLLEKDVSKKKWLCGKGAFSGSVVLQLARSVQISAITIGVHHSAVVEVLVGRSESANDPFKVLVPSCIFINPIESRKSEGLERIRSFSSGQMSADARHLKWDRVKVVCSQPFNKHCQFGLYFIHIFEYDTNNTSNVIPTATAVPPRRINLDIDSSDEDEGYKPGELFAKYLQQKSEVTDTDKKGVSTVQRQQEKKEGKEEEVITKASTSKEKARKEKSEENRSNDKLLRSRDRRSNERDVSSNMDREKTEKGNRERNEERDAASGRKRKKSPEDDIAECETKRYRAGPVSSTPNTLFSGVIFALSGYCNPRRAAVRAQALAMGARYERNWDPRCTHLICAYENTPKFKMSLSQPNRDSIAVATAEWVEECSRLRRILPWQWFATELRRRVTRPPDDELDAGVVENENEESTVNESDCDTGDEIEKVLQKQRDSQNPTANYETTNTSNTSLNRPASSGNSQGTTVELEDWADVANDLLPDYFDGLTFVIDQSVEDAGCDGDLIRQHIYAYGGEIIQESHLDEASEVSYVLCASSGDGAIARKAKAKGARAVRPDWLWRCHEKKRICSEAEYLI